MRNVLPVVVALLLAPTVVLGAERECRYNQDVEQTCAPLGCVVTTTSAEESDFETVTGTLGVCGRCTKDRDCGGAFCDLPTGGCRYGPPPEPPEPIWPHFHLITVDVAFDVADQEDARFKPIFGVGYLFEGAFRKTEPVQREDGSWLTKDVPNWYFRAGAAIALAGPAQNVFLELGPSYYFGWTPVAVTSVHVTALYQRQGSAIWELGNLEKNFHRLGPSIGVSFLQNITLAGAVLIPLGTSAVNDSVGGYVFARYDRDILSDLIPDRYLKFVPAALR